MDIVIPTIKSVWGKIYKWFKKELSLQDKAEVTSSAYHMHPDDSKKTKELKKKLTRMRVLRRKKEVKNAV
jgi:hypothetical protein